MTGILSDLEAPISKVLNLFFQEVQLTAIITYRLSQGQNAQGEESFRDFTITAIPSGKEYANAKLARILKIETGRRKYVIREADLPDDVTVDNLSTNDRIADGNKMLRVVEIDKTLGFVIELQAEGE